jgi:hypothetical protein
MQKPKNLRTGAEFAGSAAATETHKSNGTDLWRF